MKFAAQGIDFALARLLMEPDQHQRGADKKQRKNSDPNGSPEYRSELTRFQHRPRDAASARWAAGSP